MKLNHQTTNLVLTIQMPGKKTSSKGRRTEKANVKVELLEIRKIIMIYIILKIKSFIDG